MKVFGGNYNGSLHLIVAAKTKKAAAELCGVSMYHFNQFFCETGNKEQLETALAKPGQVFAQRYKDGYGAKFFEWNKPNYGS